MRRGGLGILIFLVVALLVAFLLMKQMQNPKPLSGPVVEKIEATAVQAAQSAVEAINGALQNSGLEAMIQDAASQIGNIG